ncbi:MAG: NUDIX domain-containing protein [Flavobacteriales bacterium]
MQEIKLPSLHSDFSVDCVIFGFDEGELKILLIERNEAPFEQWKALPGNLANDDEDIDDAAARVLYELSGLENIYMDQFRTFGNINRHPQGRVITVAYYAIIQATEAGLHPVTNYASKAFWWPAHKLPELAFDHNIIAEKAIEALRNKIVREPIGFELLPKEFTLTSLHHLYEEVLQKEIDKRNFRKKMMSFGIITDLKKKQVGVPHRAPWLYAWNHNKYEELKQKGFVFEI